MYTHISFNSPSTASRVRTTKSQDGGSVRIILGVIDPLCPCTLYKLFSKFAKITK